MKKTLGRLALLASLGLAAPAAAQEYYVGQIIAGGWTFCPRGTTGADGQLLAISQNDALFSLYGTTYGGDGRTTFGLPDLRGRIAMHTGQGPGLSNRLLGQKGGQESITLSILNLPNHGHAATATVNALSGAATTGSANGALPASSLAGRYYGTAGNTVAMAPGMASVTIGATGGNQSVNLMNPFTVIRYCVVLFGIYPSRS